MINKLISRLENKFTYEVVNENTVSIDFINWYAKVECINDIYSISIFQENGIRKYMSYKQSARVIKYLENYRYIIM